MEVTDDNQAHMLRESTVLQKLESAANGYEILTMEDAKAIQSAFVAFIKMETKEKSEDHERFASHGKIMLPILMVSKVQII